MSRLSPTRFETASMKDRIHAQRSRRNGKQPPETVKSFEITLSKDRKLRTNRIETRDYAIRDYATRYNVVAEKEN